MKPGDLVVSCSDHDVFNVRSINDLAVSTNTTIFREGEFAILLDVLLAEDTHTKFCQEYQLRMMLSSGTLCRRWYVQGTNIIRVLSE